MSEAPAIARASSQAPLLPPSGEPTRHPADAGRPADLDLSQIVRELPSGLLIAAIPSGKPLFYNNLAARMLNLPAWPEAEGAETNGAGTNSPELTGPQMETVSQVLQGILRLYAPFRPKHDYSPNQKEQDAAPLHSDVAAKEEAWLPGAGGARRCLALNAAPLRDAQGEIAAIVCTFEDITARKRSEAESELQAEQIQDAMESLQVAQEDLLMMRYVVEAEKQRYQELFEAATDGYITTDMNGIIDEANHAAIRRLGLSPAYVNGRILTNYVDLNDRTRFRYFLSHIREGIGTERMGTTEWEGRFTPRNNSPFDAVLTVSFAHGPEHQPVCLRWILRDVTERKQLEQARADDQARLLEQERMAGVLEERNRIAQEFHDTLAQGFTGISFLLAAAEGGVTDAPEQAKAQIARARKVATECITEARRSIHALRSQSLETGSLPVALAHVVEQARAQSRVAMDFQVQGVPVSLPAQVENDLLRIGQEAVTNALKHAKAANISVHLAFTPGQVRLDVVDDGEGLSGKAVAAIPGYGLVGMRERAQRIGGKFSLNSDDREGTRIQVVVPLPPP